MHAFLLHQLLSHNAAQCPAKDAVVCSQDSISYRDLDQQSNQLARALANLGVNAGDRVGLCLPHSIEAVVALFAILKTGAAYVPIDSLNPIERIKHIVDKCTIAVLLSNKEFIGKNSVELRDIQSLESIISLEMPDEDTLSTLKGLYLQAWEECLAKQAKDPFAAPISDDYAAYVLHTSGSTGIPKGVVVSHQNSLSFVRTAIEQFNINSDDRLSSHAPLYFDLSVFDIFTALHQQATVVMVPKRYSVFPKQLAAYIAQQKITIWNSVASVLSLLAANTELAEHSLAALRLVLFSGEALPARFLKLCMQAMPAAEFVNIYGQTEANSSMCYPITSLPTSENWRIPIGLAMPNYEVFALDDNGVPIGKERQEGELYVRGSAVAQGYLHDAEQTAEKFLADPRGSQSGGRVYKTGDLVSLDSNGNFVLIGRKDHLIKSRGYRIDLGEIESVLYQCENLKEVATVAIPHAVFGHEIIAYVVLSDEAENSDLFSHCRRFLPQYMIPRAIETRSQLPQTSTGKVDRKLLLASAKKQFSEQA